MDGILHVYDRRYPEKGIQKRTPQNLYVENYLYTQVDAAGNRDSSVETEFLAQIESRASLVLEKIIVNARRGSPPNLSFEEKEAWVKYSYTQYSRVPETLKQHEEEIRQNVYDEIGVLRKIGFFTQKDLSILDNGEAMERVWKNAQVESVRMISGKASEVLMKKGICVAVIRNPKPTRSFIIGSNPVLRLGYPGPSYISDPTTEIWLMLARDVAISPCPGESDRVISLSNRHAESLNRKIYEQSISIAGCSHKLIKSLLGKAGRGVKNWGQTGRKA